MRKKQAGAPIVPLIVAIIVVGLIVYWVTRPAVIDRTAEVEKCLEGALQKCGVGDEDLTRRSSEEKVEAGKRYLSMSYDYKAPKSFVAKSFELDLKARLAKSGFRIAKSDRVVGKDTELYVYAINYKSLLLANVKLTKRRVVAPPAVPALPTVKPAPEVVKKVSRPKVAIVIDDFGYNKNNLDTLFAIKEPVTLSILPRQKYSKEVSQIARSKGYEVILHLPMEAISAEASSEPNTITTRMSERDIQSRLASDIQAVPGITGVSNHQGSKATGDTRVMTTVMKYLKSKGLYFFDSFTAPKSVCPDVSKSVNIRTAQRDIFLDNSSDMNAIEAEVLKLKAMAFRDGRAIAVCHDRTNTIKVLAKMMPLLTSEGVEFVSLKDVVK